MIAFVFIASAASFGAAPSIAQQPASITAAPGEEITFNVAAEGDAPIAYQWVFNDSALAGQTNSTLTLTNVADAQSGAYSVTITNAAGSTNSAIATLLVTTNAFRQIGIGNITQSGASVAVPILLFGNQRESSIAFSLAYDTNAFSNPNFAANSAAASVTTDILTPGAFGVAVTLPAGDTFDSTNREIGSVTFDLLGDKSRFDGGLKFSAAPTPIAGVTANGINFAVLAAVGPHFERVNAEPVLNRQSGLFEQQILVANPSAATMTNVSVTVGNLGFDSRTNAIRLQNAQFGSTVTVANLQPGESRVLTMEYYVADHLTVPNPAYALILTDRIELIVPPAAIKTLAVDVTRYLTNTVIVEFSTRLGAQYFIQYAPTAAGLSTGKVVFPAVIGTGSRVQWIDNGPPKTDSPPTNQTRFYQILSDER